MDGLTTNGVLVMSPNGVFCQGDSQLAMNSNDNTKKNISPAKPGLWREISVIGISKFELECNCLHYITVGWNLYKVDDFV